MAKAKKTSKDVSPATRTRMQELGSAWVFKRAIQDNQQFKKSLPQLGNAFVFNLEPKCYLIVVN